MGEKFDKASWEAASGERGCREWLSLLGRRCHSQAVYWDDNGDGWCHAHAPTVAWASRGTAAELPANRLR